MVLIPKFEMKSLSEDGWNYCRNCKNFQQNIVVEYKGMIPIYSNECKSCGSDRTLTESIPMDGCLMVGRNE